MANFIRWSWMEWVELIFVELPLAVVAFGAVSNLFYISPLAALVWRSIAFSLNLCAWCILVWFVDGETSGRGGTARTRGASIARAQRGYFLVPLLLHLLLLGFWIAYRTQFADLAPLDFVTNADAFAVLRDIEALGMVAFIVIVLYWIFEARHTRLHIRITQQLQQKSSSDAQHPGH